MVRNKIFTRDFILLGMGYLLMAIAFYFLIPTLPFFVEHELKANKSIVGLVISCYTIAALIIRPFTGFAVDSLGRKGIYLISFILFSIFFNLYLFAYSIAIMVLLRFTHGLAWGATSTAGTTAVVDIIPPEKRGEGIGYWGLAMTIAMAIGPLLGMSILNNYSFHTLFITASISSSIGVLLTLFVRFPKYKPTAESKTFRWKNLIEKKSIPVALNLLIIMISYGGLLTFIAMYGQEIGIKNPGSFFVVYAVGIFLARVVAGKIYDRHGPKLITIIGIGLLCIGFPLLGLMQNAAGFYCASILLGLGNGIVFPSYQAMVNDMVPPDRRGAANSTLFTALDMGIGIGMILVGALAENISIANAYILSGGFCLTGLLLFITVSMRQYNKHRIEREK